VRIRVTVTREELPGDAIRESVFKREDVSS